MVSQCLCGCPTSPTPSHPSHFSSLAPKDDRWMARRCSLNFLLFYHLITIMQRLAGLAKQAVSCEVHVNNPCYVPLFLCPSVQVHCPNKQPLTTALYATTVPCADDAQGCCCCKSAVLESQDPYTRGQGNGSRKKTVLRRMLARVIVQTSKRGEPPAVSQRHSRVTQPRGDWCDVCSSEKQRWWPIIGRGWNSSRLLF